MWGNTLAINGVLKKKITKPNFQPVQYEKTNSTKIILETKIHKKKHAGKHYSKKKIMWGNIVAIHNVFFSRKKLQS